jgi:hypothetical protein
MFRAESQPNQGESRDFTFAFYPLLRLKTLKRGDGIRSPFSVNVSVIVAFILQSLLYLLVSCNRRMRLVLRPPGAPPMAHTCPPSRTGFVVTSLRTLVRGGV